MFLQTDSPQTKVLLVDDDASFQLAVRQVLKEGFECTSAYNSREAEAILRNRSFELVLLDMDMERESEGLEALPKLKALDPSLEIIVLSGSTDVARAVKAVELGAYTYLVKEHSPEQLRITVESALLRRRLLHENNHHIQERKRSLEKHQILGQSPAILKLLADIEKVRKSNVNVIIHGETGTGKELVARHIGAIDGRPFVAVDSSTITSTMAESILFGHERGAFTGATDSRRGLFEEAHGGTIYFDEIANMPQEIQSKILRVLQEREILRLGSSKVLSLDFRVICATNRDLSAMAEQGQFKADLFQRLHVIELRIPPLRERVEDIDALAQHFLAKHHFAGAPTRLAPDVLDAFRAYPWPGNIRELSNLMASICALSAGKGLIEVSDLPDKIRLGTAALPESSEPASTELDFYAHMHELEGQLLRAHYRRYSGNLSEMSRQLKITRSHLYSKLKNHGLHIHRDLH